MLRRHIHTITRVPAQSLGLVDSCGCRMGARFLAFGLAGSLIWYGCRTYASGLPLRNGILYVAIVSVAAALAGKTFGILLFRLRSRTR
jgi:hypothetical protein